MQQTPIHVLQVMAPPITGKSTLLLPAWVELCRRAKQASGLMAHARSEIVLADNEIEGPGIRTRAAAMQIARTAGIDYSSPEFGRRFNLPGVLDYQQAAMHNAQKQAMITDARFVVLLLPTPERNMNDVLGDKPMHEVIQEQFAELGAASFSYCGFYLEGSSAQLAGPLHERKEQRRRANGEEQELIDADKSPEDYVRRRSTMLKSFEEGDTRLLSIDPRSGVDQLIKPFTQWLQGQVLASLGR